VLLPVAPSTDTAGLLLVTSTREEVLAAEWDADGNAAAEVAGRLTREGSPPAACFPACFAALSRASWLAFIIVIQVSDVVSLLANLRLTPAQQDNSMTLPTTKSVIIFIAGFLKNYALKSLAGCESAA